MAPERGGHRGGPRICRDEARLPAVLLARGRGVHVRLSSELAAVALLMLPLDVLADGKACSREAHLRDKGRE